MEFIKKKDGTYLLVKLDKVDTKYLKDFIKNEYPKTVRNADKLFSDKLALEIETLWVMTMAMELEATKELTTEQVDQIFEDINAPMNAFYHQVHRYIEFLNRYLDKPEKRVENGVEITDVRDFLRHRQNKN